MAEEGIEGAGPGSAAAAKHYREADENELLAALKQEASRVGAAGLGNGGWSAAGPGRQEHGDGPRLELSARWPLTVVRTVSYKQDTGGQDPPRNSPASLAAGAFGKYASAVAAERGTSPRAVMGAAARMRAADALPGEEAIAQRLAEEASAAFEAEAGSHAGVASKMQSAADKFARMVALDKAPAEAVQAEPQRGPAREVVKQQAAQQHPSEAGAGEGAA
ncbi:hypothetical protein HYH03_018870 [Edaphochlamys debaryana]|uniref:Uncharacterized protein n=1 Tax=Edaphochlamys debaryana TaxID=47281 RepID=A0A835XF29_9CHLO|nr:hypothetical protein HYH03_018870 [Edaphochlamys debaryana]|eukprot:KAG2482189.1 hypothetical protein HYH03_018870 [Edaphochlamys debaryana]